MSAGRARLAQLPAYAVHRIATIKRRLLAAGRDVIDLGAGDADLPPPEIAVRTLAEAARDPKMSRYAFQTGLPEFRQAAARYLERRFGVAVDPVTELLPLVGSKEGLAHLTFAALDPGDGCLIPEPGYSPYMGGAVLAGATPIVVPLRPENGFLVELEELAPAQLARVGLVFLNYPNNPTTAVAPREYLERTVACCARHGIVLAYDNPYCEITFDGYRAPSIFEIPGAKDVAVEFHSMSKTFCMTGWRIAWAVGHADRIAALQQVKNFVDTGPFLAVQRAAAATLDAGDGIVRPIVDTFRRRRDAAVRALGAIGLAVTPPKATMYLWVPLPDGIPSAPFAERLLEDEFVAVLAGSSFGPAGEGYFRVALTVNEARFAEAATRIARTLAHARQAV
ncbi:MAG: aminotransferase class I/II-fold pyridoxal phosphate-dependent enzyme [Gemmatimonadota bacterium]|nr:aminotransferase class I/II-fold pyridoxal phosphate-dependent enzyme [Gemmatimonadota bacterium]